MNRRIFMKLVGGASGATVATSCGVDKGTEYLIPYLVPPEKEIIPGQAVYYSSTCTECPAGCGLSVKVRDGSPVKLEGLKGHPVNDGALCVRGQASLTRLYHEDRLREPMARGADGKLQSTTWEDAAQAIVEALARSEAEGSENLYLASRRTGVSSQAIDLFCRTMNFRRLPDYEPHSYSSIRRANGILFRRPDIPFYNIAECDCLLTVGADILETFVSPVSNAAGLSRARENPEFSWMHFEPNLSLTGAKAERRYVVNPGSEAALLLYLLRSLVSRDRFRMALPSSVLARIPRLSVGDAATYTGVKEEDLDRAAAAIDAARNPLLLVGGVSVGHSRGLDAAVLAGLIQWSAGMIGETVDFSSAENYSACGSISDIHKLKEDLAGHTPGVFFLAGADPIGLSHSRSFGEALAGSKLTVTLSSFLNPTAAECDIVLPLSDPLESWGDAEPRSGLRAIIQPAMEPLYDTKTEGDILLGIMLSASSIKRRRTFQSYLMERLAGPRTPAFVEALITDGFYEETRSLESIVLNDTGASRFLDGIVWAPILKKPLIVSAPSIRAYDGRSSTLPLLREIPDPLTTISYGRWISVCKEEARHLGLEDGDEIEASSAEFSLAMPVKTQSGLPAGIYSVYGDSIADWPLRVDQRSGEAIGYIETSAVSRTGSSVRLPVMSGSMSQHGRGIIPTPNHIDRGGHGGGQVPNMYPEVVHDPHRWGMAIDLDKCNGCSACVAACYIENNVPIVGLDEHLKGREMSWLRVEPYYGDDTGHEGTSAGEDGRPASFIPMLCQHCSHAPCESVCPVYATYHNPEGLNAQIYNRCVGTRYCSNNCPYKVRRFNWFTHKRPEPSDRMLNPDIFVRGKGVMEKCTFCVQRIRRARDEAKDESRAIRDGDVVPACAQTCPTGAIVFGDLLDKNSRVYALAHSKRAYGVFEELGTKPAVYYLRPRAEGHKV